MSVSVRVAVEGGLDESVARRLIVYCQANAETVYVKRGKQNLLKSLHGYNKDAMFCNRWLVIVDLDHDDLNMNMSIPSLRQHWLPSVAPSMCFQIAVRAVEAWLLADRKGVAKFLSVSPNQIPSNPESLSDPKEFIVQLASKSRRNYIKKGMVPDLRSKRKVGPEYVSLMATFVQHHWDIRAAQQSAPSLACAVRCLQQLVSTRVNCGSGGSDGHTGV